MCLCCDIINNRISKEFAQKISEDHIIRRVYDALRGPNCDGEPISKIVAYFVENNWQSDAIYNSSIEWRTAVMKKNRGKKALRNEAKNAL